MKRTPAEWARIQRDYIARESGAKTKKPRQKRGYLLPEERPKRGGLTFDITTNVKLDAALVTVKAPATSGEPLVFRGPSVPCGHDAALREIVKLTDAAIFITWAAIKKRIREIAVEALGPDGGRA